MSKSLNFPYVDVVIKGRLYLVGFLDTNEDFHMVSVFARDIKESVDIVLKQYNAITIMGIKERTNMQEIILHNLFTYDDFLSDSSLRFKARRGMNIKYNSLLSKRKEKKQ